MPNFYLFEPSGEKRIVAIGEWGDGIVAPLPGFSTGSKEYPILTMKKFDHDPHAKLKEIYKDFKPFFEDKSVSKNIVSKQLWQAISELARELEAK